MLCHCHREHKPGLRDHGVGKLPLLSVTFANMLQDNTIFFVSLAIVASLKECWEL